MTAATLVGRYVALELRRTLRDVGFLVFGIGTPVLMYLLFTGVGAGRSDGASAWAVTAMVGLAAYGALSAGVTTGSPVAEDRAAGWLRQLRLTPLAPAHVVLGRALAGTLMVLPAIVAVLVAAVVVNEVRLAPAQWVVLTLVLWVGSVPFTVIGIAHGYRFSAQTTNVANVVATLALAFVGGLWFPVSELPDGLAAVARWTPGYRVAELGTTSSRAVRPGSSPSPSSPSGSCSSGRTRSRRTVGRVAACDARPAPGPVRRDVPGCPCPAAKMAA